jgi:hypothetical protein
MSNQTSKVNGREPVRDLNCLIDDFVAAEELRRDLHRRARERGLSARALRAVSRMRTAELLRGVDLGAFAIMK